MREKGSFTTRALNEGIEELLSVPSIEEAVILSTCNRSEIYAATEDAAKTEGALKKFYCEEKSPELLPYLYSESGRDALDHLYRVTTGLDSMILGEDQILGQAKDALYKSRDAGGAGKYLSKCFREAVTFAKKMKTTYKISETPLSLSSTAVKYVRRRYPDFAKKKVLIIGSGKMGLLALRYLAAEGFKDVFLTNRTYHPGDEYDDIFEGVNVYQYDQRYDAIDKMDVVISATASPHTIIRRDVMRERTKPLLIVDLALPRDIDPEVGKMDQVELVTIDDFQHEIDEKMQYREQVAGKIEVQIGSELDELEDWLKKSKVDKIVAALNDRSRSLADETIETLNHRYHFEGKDMEYLDKIVHSKFRKMVMPTIKKLKNIDDEQKIMRLEETVNLLMTPESGAASS